MKLLTTIITVAITAHISLFSEATTPVKGGLRAQDRVLKKDKKKKKKKGKKCDPADVILADYSQWRNEVGYWIGEYSFFGADGDPFMSGTWNYPYDHYRGFITGNIKG